MVVIVDYGLGNLRSVAAAVEKVGYEPCVSSRLEDLERAHQLILPGVGAFGDGMANLRRLGLVQPLTRLVKREGKPILGICLGAQLMARESEEFGRHEGLGWLEASVRRIDTAGQDLPVPHVGWNDLIRQRESVLLEGIPPQALFYYVHSFRLVCDRSDMVVGECEYGGMFTAMVEQGNIWATQFHPEKSQLHGLTLLKNFLEKTRQHAQKAIGHRADV